MNEQRSKEIPKKRLSTLIAVFEISSLFSQDLTLPAGF